MVHPDLPSAVPSRTMRETDLLLGIDLGTSACKAVLIAADTTVIRESSKSYPVSSPRLFWSEQDPEDWWTAAVRAIRELLAHESIRPDRIRGVGLTGQMHGLVMLNHRGVVLRPAILWNDQRAYIQCEQITRNLGIDALLRHTGNAVLPGFTAPKLVWVRENEPQVYTDAAAVLLPKDYLRFRMTGERVTDVTDASGTALFDVGQRHWSEAMLTALDIPSRILPHVIESAQIGSAITPQAAGATGLCAGTPVVGGAGDQAAAAIGCGVVEPGDVCITLGTSGVVFAVTDAHRVIPGGVLHAFCHARPQTWHLMGVMLSAGGSLHWWRDVLHGDESRRNGDEKYTAMIDEAAGIEPGCEGLYFLPYLTGERTPHADPHARGAFVGLTVRHGRGHLTRAVLEGVAFGLRDALDLIRAAGVEPRTIRITGGGARNSIWRQIIADVLGVRLVFASSAQGGAYGAALLAGIGTGVIGNIKVAAESGERAQEVTSPGAASEKYASMLPRFRELYHALKTRV